ncbi:MAG: TonB-dependent receptor plug domain-containing protein [Ignavibacteriae bacterium]|nr:TonB-dependent receptor plug domain-containing protein [Ignavibacteriota bacterium]
MIHKFISQIFSAFGIIFFYQVFLFFLGINLSFSQSDSTDIYDYDFNQLSKLKITSVSKTPQRLVEVPSTIYVISSVEIKERGYFTLEDVLSDLPGFQFRNIQSFNSYSFQRGIPNQNNLILVLIDGVQVNELNSGGYYGGGQYNLSNVERIEVVYGPVSVAYGTNAVSGIINIITKGTLEKQAVINTIVGNFNTINSDISYCYTNNKKSLGIRVSGMIKSTEKADLKGTAGDNNWSDLLDNFENDYSFDIKIQVDNFILGTNFLQKQSSAATYVKSTGTIYKDYGTLWNIRFINNYLKYNNILSDNLTFTSTLYNRNATVLDNSVEYIVDTAQIGYYRPNNLTGLENILEYYIGNIFSITGGLTLEYEQLAEAFTITYSKSPEQKPPTPLSPEMKKNSLISLFLEPHISLFENIYISGGIRFDKSSFYNQVLTPSAGLSYNYQNHVIRFSYSEAFRAPKPWDYTDGLGNSSLLPEKMKSIEAAITLSIADNFKLDLIGYSNKFENAITKQSIGESYKWINEGKITTNGFEVYFRYSSPKLKSSVNYTYNQSLNSNDDFIPEISKHTGNASLTYSFTNNIILNIRANYIGERENTKVIATTNSNMIEPCLIFHAVLSFLNYEGFNLQLIGKNILNKEYYHTSNRPPDRYRQSQRTIMLSVGYSLNN